MISLLSLIRLRRSCPGSLGSLAIPSLLICTAALISAESTYAQFNSGSQSPPTRFNTASLIVYITTTENRPLTEPTAQVTLISQIDGGSGQTVSSENGTAHFNRLVSGKYFVIVTLNGFKQNKVEASVADYGATIVSVPMELDDRDYDPIPTGKGMVLAPKAKKELDSGTAALQAAKYDEAQEHFEAAYKLAPSNPDINDSLGQLYMAKGDFPKAQDYLQRALAMEPDNAAILVDLGQLRVQQHDFLAGSTTLEQAVTHAPNNPFSHWLLGVCYMGLGHYEKARTEALSSIKLSKGAAHNAQYLLGQALAGLGRNAEALQALQDFVHDAPESSSVPAAQKIITKLQARLAAQQSASGVATEASAASPQASSSGSATSAASPSVGP